MTTFVLAAAALLAAQSPTVTGSVERDKVLQGILDRAEADAKAVEGFPVPQREELDPMEQALMDAANDAGAAAEALVAAEFGPITLQGAKPDDPDLPWLISDRWSCHETKRRTFNPYSDLEPLKVSYMLSFADMTLTNRGTDAQIPISSHAFEDEDRSLYIGLSEANAMSIGLSGRGETRKLSITTFAGRGVETESTCQPAS